MSANSDHKVSNSAPRVTEPMPNLLIVSHCPSINTESMRDALVQGASLPEFDSLNLRVLAPLDAGAEDVFWADALILGSTENFGYMAGRVKDFFERIYTPCLEISQGLAFAVYIRAGNDGSGAEQSINKIVTGLRWNYVQPPLICKGEFDSEFIDHCRELGTTLAAGLDAHIY